MNAVWRCAFVLVSSLALAAGCFFSGGKSRNDDERVFVTVNGAELTETMFSSLVPEEMYDKLNEDHKKEIVDDWVENELLYQEALKRNIDEEPAIRRILETTKRNLLRNELLEIIYSEIKDPGDVDLKRFFDDHHDYFILEGDEYKIRFALFDTETEARDFWRKVKEGESFSKLAQEISRTPEFNMGGEAGIVSEGIVEPAVWKEIGRTVENLGLVKISNPFAVIDGWMCLIVDEEYKQGTVLPFDAVRNEILDMYIFEKRQDKKDEFIRQLKEKASIRYGSMQ